MTSILLGLIGDTDLWEWAKDKPYLFRPGGMFYSQVQNDLGPLKEGQHCSLPCLHNMVSSHGLLLYDLLISHCYNY